MAPDEEVRDDLAHPGPEVQRECAVAVPRGSSSPSMTAQTANTPAPVRNQPRKSRCCNALVAPAARRRPIALARHSRVEEDVPRRERARRERHARAARRRVTSPATHLMMRHHRPRRRGEDRHAADLAPEHRGVRVMTNGLPVADPGELWSRSRAPRGAADERGSARRAARLDGVGGGGEQQADDRLRAGRGRSRATLRRRAARRRARAALRGSAGLFTREPRAGVRAPPRAACACARRWRGSPSRPAVASIRAGSCIAPCGRLRAAGREQADPGHALVVERVGARDLVGAGGPRAAPARDATAAQALERLARQEHAPVAEVLVDVAEDVVAPGSPGRARRRRAVPLVSSSRGAPP